MKGKEIVGGYIQICDNCEEEIQDKSLYWKEQDFTLCIECLNELFRVHISDNIIMYGKARFVRTPINEKLRNKILKKYNYSCAKCGSKEKLEFDHIHPFSIGGETIENNLQILCKKCNRKKGKCINAKR